MENNTRSWSDLHLDLLELVARKIQYIDDFFAFRACCTSWHSAARPRIFVSKHQFPWLLQTNRKSVLNYKDFRGKDELCNPLYMPASKIFSKEIYSYGLGWRGWLLVVKKEKKDVFLLHSFLNTEIRLPHLPRFSEEIRFHIADKAALSSNPLENSSDYTLMILTGAMSSIAFWRPGDEDFTKIEIHNNEDIIFFNGFFYSITTDAGIFKFDATDPTKYVKVVQKPPLPFKYNDKAYLVELAGGLFCVMGTIPILGIPRPPVKIQVYKVPLLESEWEEINDLGDMSIFIGANTSFAVDSSEITDRRRNCVYFTIKCGLQFVANRKHPCWHHYGIYSLSHGMLHSTLTHSGIQTCHKPLIWLQPTFF